METEIRQKTKEQELIEKEFPIIERSALEFITHNNILSYISGDCAYAATDSTEKNSRLEARFQRLTAGFKTVLTLGLTALTAYVVKDIMDGNQDRSLLTLVAPIDAFLVYRNIFGKHPASEYHTYIAKPYFSIFDNLQLGNTWSKIAKLQKEGKLKQGSTEEIQTSDRYAELGRNLGGGN